MGPSCNDFVWGPEVDRDFFIGCYVYLTPTPLVTTTARLHRALDRESGDHGVLPFLRREILGKAFSALPFLLPLLPLNGGKLVPSHLTGS